MYQKHLQQVIYQRNALFDKSKIKYPSQINPSLPTHSHSTTQDS